jgi:hypothetical protein
MQLRTTHIIVVFCLITAVNARSFDAQQRTPIIQSEDGVGPLHKDTESTVSHIRTLFPRLKVVAATDMSEGIEFPTIEVRGGQTVLLEILPDQAKDIRLIVIRSPTVQYALGRVGLAITRDCESISLVRSIEPQAIADPRACLCQEPTSSIQHVRSRKDCFVARLPTFIIGKSPDS